MCNACYIRGRAQKDRTMRGSQRPVLGGTSPLASAGLHVPTGGYYNSYAGTYYPNTATVSQTAQGVATYEWSPQQQSHPVAVYDLNQYFNTSGYLGASASQHPSEQQGIANANAMTPYFHPADLSAAYMLTSPPKSGSKSPSQNPLAIETFLNHEEMSAPQLFTMGSTSPQSRLSSPSSSDQQKSPGQQQRFGYASQHSSPTSTAGREKRTKKKAKTTTEEVQPSFSHLKAADATPMMKPPVSPGREGKANKISVARNSRTGPVL